MILQEELKLFLVYLYKRHPFYNSLLSNIKFYVDSSEDSRENRLFSPEFKKIVIDKEWGEKLIKETPKKFFYFVVHEMLHMILNHPQRKDEKNETVWDLACDISVDCVITSDPTLMDILEFSPNTNPFTIENTAEDIYDFLITVYDENEQRKKNDTPQGEGENKESTENAEFSEFKTDCLANHSKWGKGKDIQEMEEEIKNMLLDAAQSSQESSNGFIPEGFVAAIDNILAPKTNILDYINKMVQNFVDVSCTYQRGDRRYLYNNLIVPSHIEDIKHFKLLFYIDTSSSMSLSGLEKSISEIVEVVSSLETFEVTIIQSDTGIQNLITITEETLDIEELLKIKGRGGTNLSPLFEFINKKRENEEIFDAIVVNTDFHISKSEKEEYLNFEKNENVMALIPKDHGNIEEIETIFLLD